MSETLHIGFIGLGLIGGSIARAFRRTMPDTVICAYTRTQATLLRAKEDGVVDVICEENDPRLTACDYLFLCAPVSTNVRWLQWLQGKISPGCIVTDVGSVKGGIHRAAASLGMDGQFIGGHPMAGSEKTGYENSTAYLLENAYYILTPGEGVPKPAVSRFQELIAKTGAVPMVISCEEHDYITAAVSHLPHIIASTLVNAVAKLDTPDEHMRLIAAGGFRDITRIASSSPVMWQQICAENREMILRVLDSYIGMLGEARSWVDKQRGDEIYGMFDASREYRNSIPDRSMGALAKEHTLYCDITDEAGGIATITTLLAMNGLNIKNIGIIHNREFEEGVLRVEFYEKGACDKAEYVLKERNYQIHRR